MSTDLSQVIGIDLGTTFSVVAYLDRGGLPQTVMNMEGDLTTPSVVFFDGEEAVVGKEAVKAAIYETESVARFAKRDMGRTNYHKRIRGTELPPEVIQAAVLQKLRRDAELKLGEVTDVVITVPAFFNEPRRKGTMDAGRLAGLNVLDIINEPTAAAIAFGVQAGFVSKTGQVKEKETILVYDLGGGTFDVTLMAIDGASFIALATDGDVQLGGVDWDRRIVDHLAGLFVQQHGVDPRENESAYEELLQEAEDAKRALSSRSSITIRYSFDGNRIQVTFTREEFESITDDLLQRTVFTVEKLLRDAKKGWNELTRILLVGGSTRMPMIQRTLEGLSGKTVDRSLSPDEAVAHGAALYAGFLKQGTVASDKNLAVKNVNSHDLGVLGLEKATGMRRRRMMIPRNTTLPARSRSRFVTHRQNQKRVVVHVVEGGDDSGKNSTAIGKCIVSDLPPNLPAKSTVIVQFHYAANGRLSVLASLPEARCEATLTIERTSGMTDEALANWAQRIADGKFLDAPEQPTQPVVTKPPMAKPVQAAPAPTPESELDFEAPQVFDGDDEDSEIFSDLDF